MESWGKKIPKGESSQQFYVFLNFAWFQRPLLYSLEVEVLCTEAGHSLSTFCVSIGEGAWRHIFLGFGEYLKVLCSLL